MPQFRSRSCILTIEARWSIRLLPCAKCGIRVSLGVPRSPWICNFLSELPKSSYVFLTELGMLEQFLGYQKNDQGGR
jgi:hypothetical protein